MFSPNLILFSKCYHQIKNLRCIISTFSLTSCVTCLSWCLFLFNMCIQSIYVFIVFIATTINRADPWQEHRGSSRLCTDPPSRTRRGKPRNPLRTRKNSGLISLWKSWNFSIWRAASSLTKTEGTHKIFFFFWHQVFLSVFTWSMIKLS